MAQNKPQITKDKISHRFPYIRMKWTNGTDQKILIPNKPTEENENR